MEEARVVVCTSGTHGTPSPVRLSTRQVVLSAFGSAIRLGLHLDDRWLCALPLHHIGGLSILLRSAVYGTTVLRHDRFDAQVVAKSLDDGEASLVSLVPTMLERVLDAREESPFPATLRAILVGGASMSEALRARCAAMSAPIAATWGMTEGASQLATSFAGDYQCAAGGAPPLSFARVDAEAGSLRVRGPLVNGALETRDLGRVDEEGRVFVEGRADDVIISGGKKISPAEVEAALKEHPLIDAAAVVAMPSQRWGERPVAVLESSAETLPSDDELRAWCGGRLTGYKIPDDFAWCDALPRTGTQKIARSAVRHAVARAKSNGLPPTEDNAGRKTGAELPHLCFSSFERSR